MREQEVRAVQLGPTHLVLQLPARACRGSASTGAPVCFEIIVDNSASMGRHTAVALHQFAPLVDLATAPSSVLVFSSDATCLSDRLETAKEVRDLALPRQGQTNISAGILAATDVVSKCVDPTVHHVMVLLTDGAHNTGPPPREAMREARNGLISERAGLRLSCLVIGVGDSSRTTIGMDFKTLLETVPLGGVHPIYFCSTVTEMSATLTKLKTDVTRALSNEMVTLRCESPFGFLPDMTSPLAREVNVFLDEDDRTSMFMNAAVDNLIPESILMNGTRTAVATAPLDVDVIAKAVLPHLDRLKQLRVANCSDHELTSARETLMQWLDAFEAARMATLAVDSNSRTDVGALSALQRMRAHKCVSTGDHITRRLRNMVDAIVAYRSDSSADQAAFLTGASGKYATKALARAGALTERSLFEEMKSSVSNVAAQMTRCLRRDTLVSLRHAIASRGVADDASTRLRTDSLAPDLWRSWVCVCLGDVVATGDIAEIDEASVRTVMESVQSDAGTDALLVTVDADARMAALVDDILPSAVDRLTNAPESYISLLSAQSQLREWATSAATMNREAECEYDLLVSVGMQGVPVAVHRSNAGQVDPWAVRVSRVLLSPVDTPSVMYAMRTGQTIVSPEKDEVTDVLLLIDPHWPNASLAAYWSTIASTLVSVTLTRDLFMYTGAEQRVALHGLSLMAIVGDENAVTDAGARQALRILYSVRRHWGIVQCGRDGKYAQLLKLWSDGRCLTEANAVQSPAQLVLALAAIDAWGDEAPINEAALLNLYNEVLSRKARGLLRGLTSCASHETTLAMAQRLVAGTLAVGAESAPVPTDVTEEEPSVDAVREGCDRSYTLPQHGQAAVVADDAIDVQRFVGGGLAPWCRAAHFAHSMRVVATEQGGWDAVMLIMEARGEDRIVARLADAMRRTPTVMHSVGIRSLSRQSEVATAMACQAHLHHVGQTRSDALPDVRDRRTLGDMAVGLRMATYERALRERNGVRQLLIGNVMYAKALRMTAAEFAQHVGEHAHKRSKKEFWALARATKEDPSKEAAFLQKANYDFRCWWDANKGDDCKLRSRMGD